MEGRDGVKKLMTKFNAKGPSVFFHGALAAASATFVGHYPWFFVYNYMSGAHLLQPLYFSHSLSSSSF